jgi:hypothetical protein
VNHTGRSTKIFAVLMAALGLALFAPSLASARFVRPLLSQITGPTSGLFSGPFSTNGPEGIAVDGSDDLWVGEDASGAPPFQLDGFSPAEAGNESLETLEIKGESPFRPPRDIAIDDSSPTDTFYVVSSESSASESHIEILERSGAYRKRFGPFTSNGSNSVDVAVDNSTGSAGTVYVVSGSGSAGEPYTIEKFNAEGEEVPFGDSHLLPYVEGNQITGDEAGSFRENGNGSYDVLASIAVNSEGDIYVTLPEYEENHESKGPALLEYAPSGAFIRPITSKEVPSLGGKEKGFGGSLAGLATAPNGDVLVSVDNKKEIRETQLAGTEATGGLETEELDQGAVDEFNAAGAFVGQVVSTTSGKHLHGPSQMAVDSQGNLYVVDDSPEKNVERPHDGGREKEELGNEHVVDVYKEGHFVPGLTLGEATGLESTGAVLNGSVDPEASVNPEHAGLSECYFQFIEESVFNEAAANKEEGFAKATTKACAPSAASIAASDTYQPVHADVGDLKSGESYRYRLVAVTGGAKGGSAETQSLVFTAPHAPGVLSTSAGSLSSKFADLEATIDPLGAATSYYFEYDTRPYTAGEAGHGVRVPVSAMSIGSGGPTGSSREGVVQHVGPLEPDTTYYFRVVAGNSQGVTVGAMCEGEQRPDCTFATLPVSVLGLPDGRAYELVTPANKESGSDMFAQAESNGEFVNTDVGTPSESGSSFLLETKDSFGPFPAAGESTYVLSRDPEHDEWATTSLADPSRGVQAIHEAVFDPVNLSSVAFTDGVGPTSSPEGERLTSLLGVPGGPYTELYAGPATHGKTAEDATATSIVGASRDMSHVVLESGEGNLCKGSEAEAALKHGDILCEWNGGDEVGGGGALKLVDVNPEGELLSACGAGLGAGKVGGGLAAGSAHNAISADGSKVFFTVPDPAAANAGPGCWKPEVEQERHEAVNPPQLYMRYDERTVTLSAPNEGVEEGGKTPRLYPATYVGAAEDGSRVFFVSEAWLTANHPEAHDLELYQYDTETSTLTRISAGEEAVNPRAKAGAEIHTVPAVAAQGTAVYFTAFGKLAEGASELPPRSGSVEGQVNLYRFDTRSGITSYVATINVSDYIAGAIALAPKANWYTNPEGNYLLFASSAELTGYDTSAASTHDCRVLPGLGFGYGHCDEVYRYHYEPGIPSERSVICVSCNPSGARPVSHAEFTRSARAAIDAGPVQAMSNNGAYVFFDSADPLVSTATNETLDVYEWHEGQIALIGSGSDPAPSFFLGMSSYETPSHETVEAGNVFIGTHANLVPWQHTEAEGNIYDARICRPEEGEPCLDAPAVRTGQCENSSCQSPPSPPDDATPTSLTFAGPGDLVTELAPPPPPKAAIRKATSPCKRGYVKKKVKKKTQCVRKARPKKAKKTNRKGK